MEALKSFQIPLHCTFGSGTTGFMVILYLGSVIIFVTTLARTHRIARSFRFPALLVIGLLATAPLLYFFAASPFVLVSRGWPLAWDTVSYHLPGLVGFLQQCSLWVVDQPYQSYSFGFELIGGFPAIFFPSHWGLVAAHVYAVIFFIAAITCLAAGVGRLMGDVTDISFPLLVLLSLALWCLVFREQLWAFGKNDIFQAACVLSMLGLILDGDHQDAVASRFRLFLVAAVLALAIATKPTSFAYVPVFIGLCFSRLWSSRRLTLPAVQIAGALLGALSIGGFFYARNLLMFGGIVDPRLATTSINTSIIGNLRNPRLYVANVDSIVFLFAACLPPILFMWLSWSRATRMRSSSLILIALHVTGVAALLVTPWLVFQPEGIWHLRLAMPFFSFVAITCSVAMIRWLDTLHGRVGLNGVPSLLLAVGLVLLPWWWHDRTPRGPPGFERVHGQPETGIYRWVQRLDPPVRIYSAGLFPYGLYGAAWANRLVYDLSSAKLETDAGRLRILEVLETFRPDLIVVGADPLAFGPPWSKPAIVAWLRQQKGVVAEVYCDETVSAFEVLPGKRHLPPDVAACQGRTSSNASGLTLENESDPV